MFNGEGWSEITFGPAHDWLVGILRYIFACVLTHILLCKVLYLLRFSVPVSVCMPVPSFLFILHRQKVLHGSIASKLSRNLHWANMLQWMVLLFRSFSKRRWLACMAILLVYFAHCWKARSVIPVVKPVFLFQPI